MWLFQDFLDQSKQLNQAPSRSLPAYHPPNKKYKIIHQALTIPNLPAPYSCFCLENKFITTIESMPTKQVKVHQEMLKGAL